MGSEVSHDQHNVQTEPRALICERHRSDEGICSKTAYGWSRKLWGGVKGADRPEA